MKKYLFFWRTLGSTFWFVPTLMLLSSMLLAGGTLYLDFSTGIKLPFLNLHSAEAGREILSVISSAMISVTGTVFSATLVVLTLASSQFGSQLVKNFMYVRINQVVLGSYIATFLFGLIILTTVRSSEDSSFIPTISIGTAILLAVINVILLIFFIHNLASSIQVNQITAQIYESTLSNLQQLYPEKIGKEPKEEEATDLTRELEKFSFQTDLPAPESGYLQFVDDKGLIDLMKENDAVLELSRRPGDYMIESRTIGTIHSKKETEEEFVEKMQGYLVAGNIRTTTQDVEYSVHQIVQVAAKALSPGVNDPFTAMTCIDYLTGILSYLIRVKFPAAQRFDQEQNLRLVVKKFDFEGIFNAAFHKIRQYAVGNTTVIIHLMDAMAALHDMTTDEGYQKIIQSQAQMILESGKRTIEEKNDLGDLTRRAEGVLK